MAGKEEAGLVHIHEIYIKAPIGAVWDAITSPEWNGRYGYGGVSHYELKPGGKFRCLANEQMRSYGLPEVIVDGEVVEVNVPNKLVQTYRFLFNEEHVKEGFSRVTFELVDTGQGFCRLTVTHDTTGMPMRTGATMSNPSTARRPRGRAATESDGWQSG